MRQEVKNPYTCWLLWWFSLDLLHNGRDGASNHQPHHCLLYRLFRRRSKKTSKLRVTGLCEGNSPVTGEFPAQMASYAENVSIWWPHHVTQIPYTHWLFEWPNWTIREITKNSSFSATNISSKILWNLQLHQPRLWFITGGYLVKRWFIPAAARARGQSNDLNREILASNLFNCHKEVINAPPVPSISRCIHIVYRHKNVWEYQWSNFIYNCMSTFLHYVHCKDALLDCSAPGSERCESLTWVDEIAWYNPNEIRLYVNQL